MAKFVLLRSTVVSSFFVSGSGSGSGSDRCGRGSGWRNSRFHIPAPQPRTSPHVTVKNVYSIQRIQGKRKLLKNPECEKYIEYNEKFQGKLWFSGQAQSCWKVLNGKKYIQYSEKFHGKLCFSRQAQVAQKSWTVQIFSIQYFQCIFTWGDACKLG